MSDEEQIKKATERLLGVEYYYPGSASIPNVGFWEVKNGKTWAVYNNGTRRLSVLTPEQFRAALRDGRLVRR